MSLSMEGQIDDVFRSVPATRTVAGGARVNGKWVPGAPVVTSYAVNIQPAKDREIEFVRNSGHRITDVRRIYINEGDMQGINESGTWQFEGQNWKAVAVDNRHWRDYCKCLVVRIDDQ